MVIRSVEKMQREFKVGRQRMLSVWRQGRASQRRLHLCQRAGSWSKKKKKISKSDPGRETSRCKGPEAELRLRV